MSRVSRALAALALAMLALFAPRSARAEHTTGTGLLIASPAMFSAVLGAEGRGWFLTAYRESDGESARIYAYETSAPVGIAPHDDVIIEPDAITIEWDEAAQIWNVLVTADLPEVGAVRLRLVSGEGFSSHGTSCTGGWNSEFVSPTRGLSADGMVLGSIDGTVIGGAQCIAWGSDVYGFFATPPIGRDLFE